ncbi:MAG: CoA-binding protein [Desulfobacterales bacterium]|nr:CoA-binding protein [Desulfobacterales bacterium]
MGAKSDLNAFLIPESVAVVGATDRPATWGSFIMRGLLSLGYPGKIYPVNRQADQVSGVPAYKDIREIKGPVELAVLAIPEEFVEEAITACGQKEVKGITIITAGFGEISEVGRERQERLAGLARSYGIRLLGPNVSGTFNLHAGFNASPAPADSLLATHIAAACQGGYAFYDILSSGWARGLGVGKFIHTGNECDLTVTDFLEYFGHDPEVKAIVMYIEAIRDGRRFVEVARAVTRTKPVVVYKGGRTPGSARAASSHTGALSGNKEVYEGLFRQAGIITSPAMELLLPLGHALIERPPMRGKRVAIVTMGGSWGVALTDALEEAGLAVPEFSPRLQKALRSVGMPPRASTRNPVDFGASGLFLSVDTPLTLGHEILCSAEVDALIVHGIGRPGMHTEDTPDELRFFLDIEKRQIQGLNALEKETGLPVLIGSHYNPWESQVVCDLNKQGIRIYNRLHETAQLLSLIRNYWRKMQARG